MVFFPLDNGLQDQIGLEVKHISYLLLITEIFGTELVVEMILGELGKNQHILQTFHHL